MKTLILSLKEEKAETVIKKAAAALKKGKTVVYPTETSYGIGCSIAFPKSIKKVYRIKKRSPAKPMLVLVDSIKTMEKYGKINLAARRLAKRFMPGPLTLVVGKTKLVPDVLNPKEISFRISSHKIAQGICRKLGKPLISASANLEGKPNIYSGKKAIEEFQGKVDLIIDAGNLKKAKPSTLFDSRAEKVLRKGPVKDREIMEALGGRK